VAAKKKKRVIRRGTGNPANMYFNADTQAAICEYQDSEDQKEKDKLYIERILPAFDKLVQNLIFIYGFAKPWQPFEHLKNDCVSFLFETLHKWNRDKGTKAFSYFNVVGKNWLIINSRRTQKNNRRHVSVDDPLSMSKRDAATLARHDVVPPPDELMIKRNFRSDIMKVLLEIQTKVTGENEKKCIDAVIKVFEQIDNLDFLNKRAIFVYVREISGLSPKQLSVAMSIIRKHYRALIKTEEFDIF
jgi:hypothetical protein